MMKTAVTGDLKTHYEAVLKDLENERGEVRRELAELHSKLRELDYSIASLSRRIGLTPTPTVARPALATTTAHGLGQKYAKISVRWAILHLLSENTPMVTSDIADVLKENGVTTRAANFTNNISAVLSSTMKGAGEVEMVDGKWRLTDKGQSAIWHIKAGSRFRAACPWADAPDAGTPGAQARKEADHQALPSMSN